MNRYALCLLFVCLVSLPTVFGQNRQRTTPSVRNKTPDRPSPAGVDLNAPPPPSPAERAAQKAAEKAAADAENEIVQVETNLVTTPVSVLDRNGRFIPGLKKKDFKIFEDGVPQAITYFQSSEQPFTVVLMIDTSPSTRYHIDDIHYAAVTFVNQLRPADKVMVVSFDSRLRIHTEPTTEKQTIFAAIYKAQFGSGTSLYDAVDYVTNLDLINVTGRKAVVLFTDGVDTTSRRANFQSTVSGVEEVDALFYPIRYNTQRRNGVPAGAPVAGLYGVIPPGMRIQLGRGQSDAEYQTGKLYLETLAANSGGRIFEADDLKNLEASFAGVAEELRRQYSIGYYASEDGKPGDRKRIKIQVSRPPRAVVKAKSTYVVKQKDDPGADPQSSSSRLQSE